MIQLIAGVIVVIAILKVRKALCRPCLDNRLFISNNAKYSRGYMIRGAKAEPDMKVEREISDWLYPKER